MIEKGFKLKTSTEHYMVCRWCGLRMSYNHKSIKDMMRIKKLAERHNQHDCRYNPANKYCQTCAHAVFDIGIRCNQGGVNRKIMPHPCQYYKQKKGDEK